MFPGSQGVRFSYLADRLAIVEKHSNRTLVPGNPGVPLGAEGIRWIRHEAAAEILARIVSCEDVVLPAVHRHMISDDGESFEVILRPYVDHGWNDDLRKPMPPLTDVPQDELVRAAMFDFLICQTDRQGKNFWVVHDHAGDAHLLLYDHQLCFGDSAHGSADLASVFYERWGHLVHRYAHLVEAATTEEAARALAEFLTPAEIAGVQERAASLLSAAPAQ